MKKVLNDLWHSHFVECELKQTEEEKQLMKNVSDADNKLREALTRTQISLLEDYDSAVCLLNCNAEKQAFIKGVKFAMQFLFETLCED